MADDGSCEDAIRDLSNSVGKTMKIIFLSEEIKEQAAQNPEKCLVLNRSWRIELASFAHFLKQEKARVRATYLQKHF